ncbi:MAG: UDP-N-acetylglucosamine 2-epimerase (non-hydrolyzing) [Phycicoccus sp.]|nr:UDP-N-acetylglucosamine 2-epimerase (non-hydrolyzing) [Phycicoccus sp.]
MKVLSVVGARPQFVKLAPVAHALVAQGHEHVIVHTGQHYDPYLSDVFFRDLDIPAPDEHLAVGSGSHGYQTGAMLGRLEDAFLAHRPDWVLAYGDTNSTLAAAVAAIKVHQPLAHLEAGLRSFNRRMPEEHNRVLTDHAADLCLAPTPGALAQLHHEGLGERSRLVGDVMTDVLLRTRDRVAGQPLLLPEGVDATAPYRIATLHRAENTDDPARLSAIIESFRTLDQPLLLLAHPRLRAKAAEQGIELNGGSLVTSGPLTYPELVAAVQHSTGVVTDSGGLQKEAFLLRVPCTTVRTETEWVETVELGWNVLVPDPSGNAVATAVQRPAPPATEATPYGTGDAADRTVLALAEAIGARGGQA